MAYTYDNADRLMQVTQGSSTVALAYDAANRRTSLTLPNGVVADYVYDTASRLTGLTYRLGQTVLGTLTYTDDATGSRTQVGGTWARTGVPDPVASAAYNAANQQTAFGPKTMSYDLNGNLTTVTEAGATTTYTWDARNRLTALSGPGLTASFGYDGLGRRWTKTINAAQTDVLYDGLNPVQEGILPGTPAANLLTGLGLDEYFTRTDVAGTRAPLTDALRSTVALTDPTGTVTTEYTYEPFGGTTATGVSSTNPYQFTSRDNDGTGLYHYRARYYHPGLQRFIAEDPIEFEGGWNLYAYVDNDPVNSEDPLGYAKGGKQKINVNLPDGRALTKKTPLDQIKQILKDAKKLGLSPETIRRIEGLKKVISRGGTIGIIGGILLDPDDANAGEDDLPKVCPAGPAACGPDGPPGSKSSR